MTVRTPTSTGYTRLVVESPPSTGSASCARPNPPTILSLQLRSLPTCAQTYSSSPLPCPVLVFVRAASHLSAAISHSTIYRAPPLSPYDQSPSDSSTVRCEFLRNIPNRPPSALPLHHLLLNTAVAAYVRNSSHPSTTGHPHFGPAKPITLPLHSSSTQL